MESTTYVSSPPPTPKPDRDRGLFCNRTLNLRSLKAIGYDMDYTLIHYHVDAWEERAYTYIKERLQLDGWPVGDLEFDHDLVVRGLVIDLELGNVVKANRFGFIKKAYHGTRPLDFDTQREVYSREYVDLKERRWVFLNTFFALSEGCIYMQLVDLLDRGIIGQHGQPGEKLDYRDLYLVVRSTLDAAHAEGRLKSEIIESPERFVDLEPEVPHALLDQKHAGKKLLLITNSEWAFSAAMLAICFDPFLPGSTTWRELFDLVIVSARKPAFFTERGPAFEVVSEDGLLRERYGPLEIGKAYTGGNAALVEASLGFRGQDILYVGDHLFTDVNISKNLHRWRTALVLRELEDEVTAVNGFRPTQDRLSALMREKVAKERAYARLRLELQRMRMDYSPPTPQNPGEIEEQMATLRGEMAGLDEEIAPMAREAACLLNKHWGLITRTGNDKSLLARQLENYADVYTARVSNFFHAGPHAYLRSHRGSLPHDPV
jgi:5'-nucleotidase